MANAINSLNFNDNIYTFTLPYGTCDTAAGTAAKTVDVDNFSLEKGARVLVKFTATNSASSPTLNVESTGAKAIYYRGSAISAGALAANRTYEFVYNGTQWDLIGDLNTNTTYSAAGTALGLVKSGGDVTISNGVITVNDDSHNHVIDNIDGLQDKINTKSALESVYDFNVGDTQRYLKVCTLTPKVGTNDYNWVKFEVANNGTSFTEIVAYAKIAQDNTVTHKLQYNGSNLAYGYVYNNGVLEVWVKATTYAKTSIYPKSQFSRNGSIAWDFEEADALPTDAISTVTATAMTWAGNAATATKLGTSTVGSSSQPIYLSAGTPTKISAVGTAYGGTGATSVSEARSNLEVYSKTEVDNKVTGVKNDLLNGAGPAYDTLLELGALIDENTDAIDALETIAASKLPKSGGAMTGDINFTNKGIVHVPGNTDQYLWKVYSSEDGNHGYRLQYNGTGGGNENTLVLIADNQKGDEVNAVTMYQDGTTTFAKRITASGGITGTLTGNATTATTATTATKLGTSTIGSTSLPIYLDAGIPKAISSAIPITYGGTGATTKTGILTNLDITATATELNTLDGITATTAELNYVHGVTSNIQTQLNAKQNTITGAATTILGSNLTASRVLISNSSGKIAASSVTNTELGYLSGLTGSIKNSLSNKVSYVGTTPVSGEASAFYCKLCTVTVPKGYFDIYLEFDLVGRTVERFQTIKCIVTKANTLALSNAKIFISGPNGNIYEVVGYKNVITSDTIGDTFELWCKVPSYDKLNVFHRKIGGMSDGAQTKIQDWITWEYTKNTALPTESSTKVKVSASLEAWQGNAKTATSASQDGNGNIIASTYLKLSGGTLTGNLAFNAGSTDKYISFKSNSTHNWRIGYTGSGSGEANYLVFQSSKDTTDTWSNALQFECVSLKAAFGGAVTTKGKLTASGKISIPTSGSSWISGMTTGNASIAISTQNTSGSYHPIIAGKTYNGHIWNLGTYVDSIGFYGFKSGRTENATDWGFAINVSSGAINASGSILAASFHGSGSGLIGLNASNISAGTLAADRLAASGVTAGTYGPSANVNDANGSTISVPQITVDAYGRVTSVVNRTYTSTGNASTATKLATARTISLDGNMSGSITFDGSGNKSFSAKIGKEWTAITTVGAYSRLCLLSGYSNWILSIQLSQNSQVSYHTYLIGIGYECGSISQIGNTGYTTYSNQVIRLGRSNATSAFVEILNNYSYNSATIVNCTCKLIPLSESATLSAQTYYTAYTAGASTSTVWAEITSQGKGIVSSTFYGNLSGNASTATNVAWSGITSKPSYYDAKAIKSITRSGTTFTYTCMDGTTGTFTQQDNNTTYSAAGDSLGLVKTGGDVTISSGVITVLDDSHNHTSLKGNTDNRAVATTPNDYNSIFKIAGLKTNSYIGSPSTDDYSGVIGFRQWSDNSGGNAHELAFNNSGLYMRQGANTSWGTWEKFITSGNYTSYTVKKDGTGASGTWGISISGNAGTATAIKNYYTTRPSSADLAIIGDGAIRHFKATASMKDHSSYPGVDAHVLHFDWDNTGGYTNQLALPTNDGASIRYRQMYNGTWRNWRTVPCIDYITGSGSITVTLADNTEYRYTNVSTLNITYPSSGNFECWIRVAFATSGTRSITFPSGTSFIGSNIGTPVAGGTYEISIKDKVAIIKKVG